MKLFLSSLLFLCFAFSWLSPSWALADRTNISLSPLTGNLHGEEWLKADPKSKLVFCNQAFVAFRGSPSQSYIISSNVQSLTPAGLCDRLDQYFSIEENLDTRLGSAAGIAPILFADTPLGTKYPSK